MRPLRLKCLKLEVPKVPNIKEKDYFDFSSLVHLAHFSSLWSEATGEYQVMK
jgi:hypothetical protein